MRKHKSINRPLLCLAFFKGFFFVKFIDLMIYSSTKNAQEVRMEFRKRGKLNKTLHQLQ